MKQNIKTVIITALVAILAFAAGSIFMHRGQASGCNMGGMGMSHCTMGTPPPGHPSRNAGPAAANPDKTKTVTLGITGIQCQACADRLQSSLESAAGVESVTVTADPARAVITYDPAKTSVPALKDAIRNTKPIHEGTPFGAVE